MISKNVTALYKQVQLWTRFGLRKVGFPDYQIHVIELEDEQLIYIPIPKNACSTIKHALYEIEFDKEFDYDRAEEWGYQDIHDYYKKRSNAFSGLKTLDESDFKVVTIIREPVQRLVSCYRNRVVDLKDLEKNKSAIHQRSLPMAPDLNTFVLRLEEYREANKIIEHHSRPQHKFLDNSLEYIDEIYPLNRMDELKKMLQELKPDLQLKAEKSGGTSFSLADLSEAALEKAINFYQQDYKLLSDFYKPDEIREAYHKLTF